MDKATLMELTKRRDNGEFENPVEFDAYIRRVAECVGKDRNGLIDIINNEPDCCDTLYEAYEEIMASFPGDDELEDLFIRKVMPVYA